MKFGLTQSFNCSYLPEKEEQLLVYTEREQDLATRYSQLIRAGFRRSGNLIYRPHCPSCDACQSIRIPIKDFSPSRSQRRLLNKNKHLNTQLSYTTNDKYYPLYERYINTRHQDGSMYPASVEQYKGLIECAWKPPIFIEAYLDNELVAVAITDHIEQEGGERAFSALYTFFAPELAHASMGTWMILQQITHGQAKNYDFLYLGYQVDACQKMNYKTKFLPHERFLQNKWQKNPSN
ncbi:arginyltransferase [Alteromonas sp. C1M14]|uniref:arginyltransferase n=1 Tax=Alteromonas sp. C1M14 TaxID=2841567 RepID=UPI001C083671|nr:arginyltransferase [Alteromonas sp. C1M14]MBU2977061.1 arginyltransferase [Alteromonas sp. C1M14]